jgi:uncharacterized membrane protein YphA (DoxX/SURF4 family)
MKLETTLDRIHSRVTQSTILQRFTVFTRILLAAGFFAPGLKKVMGLPFTQLPANDGGVGYFFDALYHTGFWYEFIGWGQVIAAVLLLFPRTATLGAAVYFPIIVNIAVLTNSVGFRGTEIITIFMSLACTYLLCWDYDKFKRIIFTASAETEISVTRRDYAFEAAVWASLATLAYTAVALSKLGNVYKLGFIGAILFFAFGLCFGLFSVWHRRGLAAAAKNGAKFRLTW